MLDSCQCEAGQVSRSSEASRSSSLSYLATARPLACTPAAMPDPTQSTGPSLPSQSEMAAHSYQSSEVSHGKAELEAQSATRFVTFRAPMRDLNRHLFYVHTLQTIPP